MDERHVELILDGDKVVAVKPAAPPVAPDNKNANDDKTNQTRRPSPS